MVSSVQDAITVRRVFGEPFEKDGVTVIPAARVAGGGGGGTGRDESHGEGEGGGFGINASPAGALVIGQGTVKWVPAVDPVRIIGAVAMALVAFGFARGWVLTRAAKARRIQAG